MSHWQESAFLLSAAVVLMLGMVFASKGFTPSSVGYKIFVVLTAALIVGSAGAFIALFVFEMLRTVKVGVHWHTMTLRSRRWGLWAAPPCTQPCMTWHVESLWTPVWAHMNIIQVIIRAQVLTSHHGNNGRGQGGVTVL